MQPNLVQTNDAPVSPDAAVPSWPLGTPLDLYVYISSLPSPLDLFSDKQLEENVPNFVWNNIVGPIFWRVPRFIHNSFIVPQDLGDWADTSRSIDFDIAIPHVIFVFNCFCFGLISFRTSNRIARCYLLTYLLSRTTPLPIRLNQISTLALFIISKKVFIFFMYSSKTKNL